MFHRRPDTDTPLSPSAHHSRSRDSGFGRRATEATEGPTLFRLIRARTTNLRDDSAGTIKTIVRIDKC